MSSLTTNQKKEKREQKLQKRLILLRSEMRKDDRDLRRNIRGVIANPTADTKRFQKP